MNTATIEKHGVKIGDTFKQGKHAVAIVADIREVRSLVTGDIIEYQCIAKATGLSSNYFPVPFSTVIRNRIN